MAWDESVVVSRAHKEKRLLRFRFVCVVHRSSAFAAGLPQCQKGMDVSFTGILSTVEGIVKEGMNSETCTAADLCFSLQVSPYRKGWGGGCLEGRDLNKYLLVTYPVLREYSTLYKGRSLKKPLLSCIEENAFVTTELPNVLDLQPAFPLVWRR